MKMGQLGANLAATSYSGREYRQEKKQALQKIMEKHTRDDRHSVDNFVSRKNLPTC